MLFARSSYNSRPINNVRNVIKQGVWRLGYLFFFLLVSLSLKKEVLPKSLTTKPLTT